MMLNYTTFICFLTQRQILSYFFKKSFPIEKYLPRCTPQHTSDYKGIHKLCEDRDKISCQSFTSVGLCIKILRVTSNELSKGRSDGLRWRQSHTSFCGAALVHSSEKWPRSTLGAVVTCMSPVPQALMYLIFMSSAWVKQQPSCLGRGGSAWLWAGTARHIRCPSHSPSDPGEGNL